MLIAAVVRGGRQGSRRATGAVVALALLSTAAGAQENAGRASFIAAHRCAIVERLAGIHASGDPSDSKDRFIAVTLGRPSQAYVQCLFFEQDTRMLCEASSGFYEKRPEEVGRPRVLPGAMAPLAALGFSTDPTAEATFHARSTLATRPTLAGRRT